ncbi:MAG: ATP synthase F1 subunit delta [Bacteroidota bacterium]
MMSAGRIAVRYAKPLLELAREKSVLDEVKEDMESFSSLCKENRDFALMLKSPIIPHLKKAEILNKAFKGKYTELTLEALGLIARKNREALLEAIANEFVALYNDMKGISKVTVTTTFTLDSDLKTSFENLAKEVTGNIPLVFEIVDPEILGGYIMQFGDKQDKQIDDSVRGQLKELKLKFSK